MNDAVDRLFRENAPFFDDLSLGIDETAHSRIGSPCNVDTILDGPESGNGQMLVGCGASAEPGIVCARYKAVPPA